MGSIVGIEIFVCIKCEVTDALWGVPFSGYSLHPEFKPQICSDGKLGLTFALLITIASIVLDLFRLFLSKNPLFSTLVSFILSAS